MSVSPSPIDDSQNAPAVSVSSVPPPNRAARAIGKRPRISRFRAILLTATALCHLPFVFAAIYVFERLGTSAPVAWLLATMLACLGVYGFGGRAELIANDRPRSFAKIVAFDLPYYVHWCACVFSLLPSIVYLTFEPIIDALRDRAVGPSGAFFVWTYAVGLVLSLYGVTLRRWFFLTRRVDIPIAGLDPKLDGYRIVHLSDLHIGALTPSWWAMRWVERANAERPDAVAVTGDLVTSGIAFHEDIANVIGSLRARDGVFCSMGNHDYFGEGEPLVSHLRARGALVLRNEGAHVERDGARLYFAAIDDTWTKRANAERAMADRPEAVPAVVLAHDPDRFPDLAARGADLVLSGHTHGGQIALPFLARWVNASRLAHHFHLGLYRDGRASLYVHPGLGTTGPPVRLGVAPAIVVLTLRASA